MFRIFCESFKSAKVKSHSLLLENTVPVSFSVFGLQTKRNISNVDLMESRKNIVKSTTDYMRSVLRHDSKYSDLFYNAQTLPELENKCESLKIFQKFYENPDETHLTNLDQLVKKEFPQLTFDEKLNLIYWFLKCFEKNKTEHLWEKIGKAFQTNLHSFHTQEKNKLFQSFDVLYSTPSRYLYNRFLLMVFKVIKRINQLTPQEFVLACKYGLQIKNRSEFKILNYNIDKKLSEVIQDLSMEEINIVSAFYYLRKFFFSHSNTEYILNRLTENIESPTAFDYQCVMIVLCKKRNFYKDKKDFELQILNCVSNFNLNSLINLCYLPAFTAKAMKLLTLEALNKCNANFNEVSLTTIKRLSEAMFNNNIRDETFIKNIIKLTEEIMERDDRKKYLSFVSKMLFYLVNFQVYPEKLMQTLMSPEFCKTLISEKTLQYAKNWGFAYYTLEIENPKLQQQIPLELLEIVDRALKYYKSPLTIHPLYSTLSYRLGSALSKLYAPDKYFWMRVLPHFKPKFVLRFDKNFQAKKLPDEFKNVKKLGIKKPTDPEDYWICLCLENSSAVLRNNEMTGTLATKLKQFNAVGYGTVRVQITEFQKSIYDKVDHEFLLDKINSTLHKMAESKSC